MLFELTDIETFMNKILTKRSMNCLILRNNQYIVVGFKIDTKIARLGNYTYPCYLFLTI